MCCDQAPFPVVGNRRSSQEIALATLERVFLEPLNTLTHLIAALLAAIGVTLLLWLSRPAPGKMLSLLVYGVSLVLLFLASTLLHGLKVNRRIRFWLNRFDHMAIFLLIAGTYTPIVYNLFPSGWRWPVLAAVWLVALMGMGYKLASVRIHGFVNVSIYVLLGWGGAVPLALSVELATLIPSRGMMLLLMGGLIYSTGFVIYYRQRPDPWPGVFGHHEIWHLFVIGGSLCHYLFMLLYVIPASY